ncbi:MAG: ATP-binding cassette domain-containing protein [Spirochaetales bacterium]|jgi:peptide/nickel transport system ATP-binding protein|nr:ATP-binding cassette domain-containing protein [Spirochaetales bacterium]
MIEKPTAICSVKGLKKHFPIEKGFMKRTIGSVKAVDNVTFSVFKGETLGVVGESGCGKSTLGKTMLRLYDVTEGDIQYRLNGEHTEVTALSQRDLRANGFRRNTQMIFQDPNSSLDPRMNVMEIINEPVVINGTKPGSEIQEWVEHLMATVGLDRKFLKRYPHAFSGGQRQRISIARALSTNPEFVVADEPTSALDVSVQAQILNLLVRLQREFELSYMFISHNLGVVRHVSDRVLIMYLGRMAELAPVQSIFSTPKHPYTEALLKSVPIADPKILSGLESAPGEIGNPVNPPSGCYFHPRCRYADDRCREEVPDLQEYETDHFVSCHHFNNFSLDGVDS